MMKIKKNFAEGTEKAKKYTEGYLDEYNNSYSSVKTAIKKVDSKEMNSYYTFYRYGVMYTVIRNKL